MAHARPCHARRHRARRHRARRVGARSPALLVGLALVAVALGGCVADASGDEAVSTTYAPPADTVPDGLADLEAIMPSAPPGFLREPDQVAGAGPVDLEAAVLDEGRGDSLQALADAGFVRGYQRRFVDSLRARRIDVWVFELGSPDASAGHALRDVADAAAGAELIDVTTIPDVAVWRRDRPDSSIVRGVLARGRYFVRIEVTDPDGLAAQQHVLDLASTMHTVLEPMASAEAEVVAPPTT